MERIQTDLSWIGIFSGQITGRSNSATRHAIGTFQSGLGYRATGQLSRGQAAILRERAESAREDAMFRTETVEWTGMRLDIPHGFYGQPNVFGDDAQNVRFLGRDTASSSIFLHRYQASYNVTDWLQQLRLSVTNSTGRILVSGTRGQIAYLVSVQKEDEKVGRSPLSADVRTYSVFEVSTSEIRGIQIDLLEGFAPHMRPVVGEILSSFEPMHGRGVPYSRIQSRLRSGDFPGGQSQSHWSRKLIGNGSGSIVSVDGHVLTNQHVVAQCESLTVNGSQAILVGSDVRVDLALLLAPSLVGRNPVRFADRPIELGEPVIVMGYPVFDISPSLNVTTGIVSSTVGYRGDRNRIQITAPVQPGNSGGPVFSLGGAQVAVVAAKPSVEIAFLGNIENIGWVIRGAQAEKFLRRFGVVPLRTSRAYDPTDDGTAGTIREWRRFTVRVECLDQ